MTAAAPVWSPACLDDDDLAGWSLFNQRITGPGRATSPCADCTPAFADEMRPLGRCNGTPGATGQVMALPTPIRVPEEDPLTAPAPPALPCEDCLHAAVCKLRDLIPHVTGPIEVGPGLRVRYTEVVECDHYLVETEERRFLAARVAELAPVPTPADRRPAQSPEDLEARRQKVAAIHTQASRQRGADANRDRAAAIRATKDGQAIGLLREHEGNAEAVGKIMSVTGTAVRGWVARMAGAGSLPDDVAALVATRARKARSA